MKTLKNLTITTPGTRIEITDAYLRPSNFEVPKLSFTLRLDDQCFGEYSLILGFGASIEDVYLDCGRHLPETEDDQVVGLLQEYVEGVRDCHRAIENGDPVNPEAFALPSGSNASWSIRNTA